MKSTLAIVLSTIVVASGSVHGAILQIDFGTDAGSQAGWQTLGGAADGTSQSGSFAGYTDLSAGSVSVSLTNLEFNRQYNNSGTTLVNFPGTDLDAMYSDMLLRNDNALPINLTIEGLRIGTYQITTHHLIGSATASTFNLEVQDANSPLFSQSVGNFAMGVGNATTSNPTVITFQVESNGTDPIILRMTATSIGTGGNTGGWFGYNGMEIANIPEPTTALLGSLGILALLRRRR